LDAGALRRGRRRGSAALLPQFLQELDLNLLNFEEAVVLAAKQVIDFFVQVPDLQLRFEIDFVVIFSA
jgi:hypothetical protein